MFTPDEFDQKVGAMEVSILSAFESAPQDARVLTLRDLLLAQLKVCSLHYKLIQLEAGNRLSIDGADFSNMISKHLELAEFFRAIPKSSEKPSYEMKSILSLYRFISHHSGDDKAE